MGYRPTKQDIIYARKKTLGITQTSFMSNGIKMTMVDVGGQKTERKKWIKCKKLKFIFRFFRNTNFDIFDFTF